MPAAKLCSSGPSDAMKSEEGNDTLDTFIRQAIGKEPLLPYSRTGDNPVQWIQLLNNALDQPDLPGWPLLTPLKVQMQKCEKCSREFCSPINYRRHIRVHRRSLNVNKESHKDRDLLAAFWDKLSLEETKEVVSFNGVTLKEIPGSSVVRALASSLRKPGVWTLPQVYVKAGSTLVEIIQAKPSRLPISSQELFSILDDASEKTFLCAGTAESVQRYVFDGETAKNSLELKNLVASTSFLFEQELVKAWIADKDAEALRCQKLLVEEEEAAQKKQAAISERKKQKKLRQKEQKVKEQFQNEGLNVVVDEVDRPDSAEESGPSSPSDYSNSNSSPDVPSNPVDSYPQSEQQLSKEPNEDIEPQFNFKSEHINWEDSQPIEPQIVVGPNIHRHSATTRWQVPRPQRGGRYGSYVNQNLQVIKTEQVHKAGPPKDRVLPNGRKVWTKKLKTDGYVEILKPHLVQEETNHQIIEENNCDVKPPLVQEETNHQIIEDSKCEVKPPLVQEETNLQIVEENNCEVIIGSISVTLKGSSVAQQHEAQEDACSTEHDAMVEEKNDFQKLLERMSDGVTKNNEDLEGGAVLEKVHERTMSSESSIQSQSSNDDEEAPRGYFPFSSEAAREFLAKRWKEAISGDHVTLVLSSPSDVLNNDSTASDDASDVQETSALGNNGENQFGRNGHVKFRKKPEMKIKYIPKQKAAA